MSDQIDRDDHSGTETTGHEWDGIKELNTPLPRWWLWTFYATIFWGVIYTILYPAWPLLTGATPGLLGYSTRAEVAAEIRAFNEANAANDARLVAADLTRIAEDPDLSRYAVSGGAAVFRTWCAQCHGSGAAGAPGFPNLLDDDWLWGGDITAIHKTISEGIRSDGSETTRYSEMPAFEEVLEPGQIAEVVQYVLSLSGRDHDPALADRGRAVFSGNCAACHGATGTGDRTVGAPNLADAIWLWGGDPETVTRSVEKGRFGVMPHWSDRLSESQIRQVSVYVHGLGGGERSEE